MPYFSAATLDDLLRDVFERIDTDGISNDATKGANREVIGALAKLTNPLARLSRSEGRGKLFSCLGELCWYLSGCNDAQFITYYIPGYSESAEDGLIFGGYGPRLIDWKGQNQLKNVLALLQNKPGTRRAVIQLFDALDIREHHEDVPCTCTMQFMARGSEIHMFTAMRSNDAYIGLPHDVFCFTMLQEIIARSLGLAVGTYNHAVGSMHLYTKHDAAVKRFLAEGWQSTTSMPPMPNDDPWPSVQALLAAEEAIRNGNSASVTTAGLHAYWADLVRLLLVFRFAKDGNEAAVRQIMGEMASHVYDIFIEQRLRDV